VLVRLDGALARAERASALAAGLGVGVLILLASVQIVGRKAFNTPLPGFIDWVEQAMAVIAFLGLAYCQGRGGHIRMEIVLKKLSPRARIAAEAISILLSLAVVTVLIWGSWLHFARAFDWSAPMFSRDSSIDIGLPLWPAKLLVPLSFAALWMRMALQTWDFWRALLTGTEPLIVPEEAEATDRV